MRTLKRLFLPLQLCLSACILLNASCKKGNNETLPDEITSGETVKSKEWGASGRETYTYNPDNSLKQSITSSWGMGTIVRDFNYEDGRLSEIIKSHTKKEKFSYNAAGQISEIVETINGDDRYGSKLEFEYNSDGSVKILRYFRFDHAKTSLQGTSYYEYYKDRHLAKITSIDAVNTSHTWTYHFDNYADDFQLNPWSFIDSWNLVDADFQVYNLPVLRRMRSLPQKITRILEVNGAIQETREDLFNYTIMNNQLQKMETQSEPFEIIFQY
jgi:hypothetical protein